MPEELICPSCADANPESARFCAQCGAALLPTRQAAGRAEHTDLRGGGSAEVEGEHWEAPFASDVNLFDRRPDGWGTLYGSGEVAARLGGSLLGTPVLRVDWAALVRHADGWFALALLGRDTIAYVEIFGDERTARERYAALVEDREGAITVRLGIAWVQALNRRDRAAARACLHDEMLLVEHRKLSSFARETTVEPYLDQILGAVAVADDLQWWWRDLYEDSPGFAGRSETLMRGHLNDGGGLAEIRVDLVYLRRGERIERIEMYEPEALAEQRARVAELAAAGVSPDENPRATGDAEDRQGRA